MRDVLHSIYWIVVAQQTIFLLRIPVACFFEIRSPNNGLQHRGIRAVLQVWRKEVIYYFKPIVG